MENNIVFKYTCFTLSEMYNLKDHIESKGIFVTNICYGNSQLDSRILLTQWKPVDEVDNMFVANCSCSEADVFDKEYYYYHKD